MSTQPKESEIMHKVVYLNKWVQRLMYTIQTEFNGPEDTIIDDQIFAIDLAIANVISACELQDKNRYHPGSPAE